MENDRELDRAAEPEAVQVESEIDEDDDVRTDRPLSKPAPAPAPETPAEEPTRPVTDFDRRTWELMGGKKKKPPLKEPAAEDTPAEETVVIPEEPEEENEKRDFYPIRFSRNGRTGCLGGLMYATFVICLSIVLACVMWMAASDVLALNKPDSLVEVTLPQEIFHDKTVEVKDEDGNVTGEKTVQAADVDSLSRLLKEYGVINYKWLFKLFSRFSNADEKVDPGTYELNTNYDYRALVTRMQVGSGAQLQTLVTLPEGFTMAQIFARLEENGVCSAADLYEAAATAEYSYAFLEDDAPQDASRLEGFLFPDSYYFYQGMQASSAINKFLSNFHYKLTAEMLQNIYERGLSYRDTVTIASLIEREAANDDERYLIASVIYNRLAQNMPLQIDAAVLYGEGNPEGVSLVTTSMVENAENPYNTYMYTGLPPGPICNPGLASIRATLNPGNTQYLYYALDEETGTHSFFLFYDEFTAFLATQSYFTNGENPAA